MTIRRALANLARRLRRSGARQRFDAWPGLLVAARPLAVVTPMVWDRLPLMEAMPRAIADTPCHIFVVLFWTYQEPARQDHLARWVHRYTRAHPRRHLTVLANEPEIVAPLRREGVEVELVHQNVWLDERIFRPLDREQPEFDAVYNAKFARWKRHELARDIERLALIGYLDNLVSARAAARHLARLREVLPRATFCNQADGGALRWLSPTEVNALLNRARVGLCLSAEEGGMFASMEYLLSGLPVVSTRSRGGRDYFFDPEYCRIVEPDPEAVRAAVAELIALGIPRATVRGRTLARVQSDRARFVALLQRTLERGPGPASAPCPWRDQLAGFWPAQPVTAFWEHAIRVM
jgi:glycosyltransferase involved in cell wall biosynthesis